MDTNSQEPPLSSPRTNQARGHNNKLYFHNKPAAVGSSRFHLTTILDFLAKCPSIVFSAAEKGREKIGDFIFWFERIARSVARKNGLERAMLYQALIIIFIVFIPWISQASITQQQESELKAYSQILDPIAEGKIAMSIDQYLPPELYADPDTVALNAMARKSDSYTLQQQLSLNVDNKGPERQAPTYELKGNETITQVAAKFNLHVGTILAANNIKPTDLKKVKPGTMLVIPSSDTDTSNDWLVAINKADADAKAAVAAANAAAAKKAAAAKAKTNSTTSTITRVAAAISSTITVIGTSYEQCVPWARANSGIQIHGYAGDIAPTQSSPQIGAVALDRFFGHASVVVGIGDGYIIVHEANYMRGKITERKVSTAAIRGYVY